MISEESANRIVHNALGLDGNELPEDGKNKDEFGCVVKNGEPPMTKCEEVSVAHVRNYIDVNL